MTVHSTSAAHLAKHSHAAVFSIIVATCSLLSSCGYPQRPLREFARQIEGSRSLKITLAGYHELKSSSLTYEVTDFDPQELKAAVVNVKKGPWPTNETKLLALTEADVECRLDSGETIEFVLFGPPGTVLQFTWHGKEYSAILKDNSLEKWLLSKLEESSEGN